MTVIEAHNLSVDIGGRRIFGGATVECRPGEMTALVGPSGSGKTTLLHCLGLLLSPTSGAVRIDGVDATRWRGGRRRRFWRTDAAFVLQDYGVLESESVEFNVSLTGRLFRRSAAQQAGRVAEALERTGLSGRQRETAAHLSGGERQRLAVARAIYREASVLYVDEPTASLDGDNRDRVVELFVDRARHGCTVIVSTHDDRMVAACDRQFSLSTLELQPAHGDRPDVDAVPAVAGGDGL